MMSILLYLLLGLIAGIIIRHHFVILDFFHNCSTSASSKKTIPYYPITCEGAKKLSLHVTKDIPPELYQLMSLYPQPVRHQPSVEYIPVPRFKGPAPKS